jgi:hypothetical protein
MRRNFLPVGMEGGRVCSDREWKRKENRERKQGDFKMKEGREHKKGGLRKNLKLS